jgi:hypothetical protein
MQARVMIVLIGILVFAWQAQSQEDAGGEQVRVFYERGRIAGWPAAQGLWCWGNEILVGFSLGYLDPARPGQSEQDPNRLLVPAFARSLDGGETWAAEFPHEKGDFLVEQEGPGAAEVIESELRKIGPCPGGLDFTHPDFALAFRYTQHSSGLGFLYYSYSRGRDWEGPFLMPDFGTPGISPRVDYLVDGKHECTALITASKADGKEGRPLCIRTRDGAKTWELVGWVGPEPAGYAIMPSTVRISDNELFTAIRCLEGEKRWISAYASHDNGRTWEDRGKPVADTGAGNPPSLIQLRDGRLCLTYGYRGAPFEIRAKISADGGRTWGEDLILRTGAAGKDLGYPRSVQRPDGKVVAIYYLRDATVGDEKVVEATIWDPVKR